MDQLIPLLVIAALALGKWFIENLGRSQESNEPDETPSEPRPRSRPAPRPPRNAAETDEEKMRRFMEALGLPAESAPPPPVQRQPERPSATTPARPQPRPTPVRKTGMPPSPPIVEPSRAPRRRLAPQSAPIPTVPTPSLAPDPMPKAAPVTEAAPAMEISSIPQMMTVDAAELLQPAQGRRKSSSTASSQPATPASRSLRDQLLGNPASLRNAILLKEILGTPKGLQSAQTSTSFSPL